MEQDITLTYKILVCYALAWPIEILFSKEYLGTWSSRLINCFYMLVYVFVGGYLVRLVPSYHSLLFHSSISHPVVYAFAFVFLADTLFYVYHRLQHSIPLLWKVHRLHHSGDEFNVTTGFKVNFLENIIQYIFVSIPPLLLLGYHQTGLQYVGYVLLFVTFFTHLGISARFGRLSLIIVTPEVHRAHHVDGNKNFAQVFPIFDMLGKTYKKSGA